MLSRRRELEWLHPGWSWTVGRAWVITALSASVTLILGAVLGALPALLAGSWRDPQTRDQTWVLIGFTVASLAAAVTAIGLHRKRRWVLRENGTAYVIRELASDWDRQDEQSFMDSAGRYFARVIKVPGPGQLGRPWDWPLGPGAQRWDSKVDELTRSFQALRTVDDPTTPNGIVMWAPWAIALAFGMRVTAADRALVLDVWQRPSHGRAGDVRTVIGTQRPHRFGYPAPCTGRTAERIGAPGIDLARAAEGHGRASGHSPGGQPSRQRAAGPSGPPKLGTARRGRCRARARSSTSPGGKRRRRCDAAPLIAHHRPRTALAAAVRRPVPLACHPVAGCRLRRLDRTEIGRTARPHAIARHHHAARSSARARHPRRPPSAHSMAGEPVAPRVPTGYQLAGRAAPQSRHDRTPGPRFRVITRSG